MVFKAPQNEQVTNFIQEWGLGAAQKFAKYCSKYPLKLVRKECTSPILEMSKLAKFNDLHKA